ncbi:MAG TPA: tautomerase family protein [Ornithinibacter sp.]|nr:tautomerase family protein [Ornithinibacter sp.]
MPLIEVTMVEGRTPQQVRALISALTSATAETVDAPVESIRVVVREVPTTHWGAGDVTIAERRGAPDPRDNPAPAGLSPSDPPGDSNNPARAEATGER